MPKIVGTYNRDEFYNNWDQVSKNIGKRWDNVIKKNPHQHLMGHTLTDNYYTQSIIKQLDKLLPKKKKLRFLKFDLYNEATTTSGTTEWLLKRDIDVYGVDISREVVKLAKKRMKNMVNIKKFVVGDIRELPFKDNFFDVVFSFGTIEHIREQTKACCEAFRVLKPGGLFISGVNNRFEMWGAYFIYELTNNLLKDLGASYEPSFYPWEQPRWFKKAGFEGIKNTGWVTFPKSIRYLDLFFEWKKTPKWFKVIWEALIIRPFLGVAFLLDHIWMIKRYFAMHVTTWGYKPKALKKSRLSRR